MYFSFQIENLLPDLLPSETVTVHHACESTALLFFLLFIFRSSDNRKLLLKLMNKSHKLRPWAMVLGTYNILSKFFVDLFPN